MRTQAQGNREDIGGEVWRGRLLRGRDMSGRGRGGRILLFLVGEEAGEMEGRT